MGRLVINLGGKYSSYKNIGTKLDGRRDKQQRYALGCEVVDLTGRGVILFRERKDRRNSCTGKMNLSHIGHCSRFYVHTNLCPSQSRGPPRQV
jgi:hypothetical protein